MPSASRVALVTGAAKGIGAGIAEAFLRSGSAVAAFDIDAAALESRAAAWDTCDVLPLAGDVAREEDVRGAVARAMERFGRIDVLVNNAGIVIEGAIPEYEAAKWDRQLAVNLKGAFLFAKHVIPCMTRRGGSIVNISSVHAFASFAGSAAYDASKAGMLALTRTLALEHGREGIRVNAVCPGYIHTPMHDEWLASLPDPEAAMREVISFHPAGRIGTPADVAAAVLFLSSPDAGFITGATLVVDGGMTIAGR